MKDVPGVGSYTLSHLDRPFTQATSMMRSTINTTFPKDQRGEIKVRTSI